MTRLRIPKTATAPVAAFCLMPALALADHASPGFGVSNAAPINTQSAITLPVGTFASSIRNEYISFDEFGDAELRRRSDNGEIEGVHSVSSLDSLSIAFAYGLTDNFTLGLRIPYIFRDGIREPESEHGHGEEEGGEEALAGPVPIETLGDVEGLGDITAFGQYRFWHDADTHAALLLGVKLPTGETEELADEGFIAETEFQPGSGSFDGLAGLAFTQTWDRWAFNSNVLYSIVGEGDQFTNLGDIFNFNFALSYRYGGAQGGLVSTTHKPALDLIVELNGEWREQETVAGEIDPHSGGTVVYVSPGVRFSAGSHWNAAVSLGIPFVTELEGEQVEPEYRLVSSIGFAF